MLTVSQLSIARGGVTLFENLEFSAAPGDRVGIIGPNGCGKSSLFQVILGNLEAERGEVDWPRSWSVAMASQQSPSGAERAIDYVIAGNARLAQLIGELAAAEAGHDGKAQARLHQDLEAMDGYSAEARAGSLLHGLGFAATDQTRPLDDFSGGWRGRLALARCLFKRPDLLLLDEPTNHLDLPAVDWLADWISSYPGLVLCISHDRDFLDRIATHILWIDRPAPRFYQGNLSTAETRRAQIRDIEERQRSKNLKQAEHLQRFVDRFRAKASKATQAQSRLKMLERLEISAPIADYAGYRFSFPDPERVCSPLLSLNHADIGYGGEPVLHDVHLSILPGERIGLLGANGQGKSTLIKALAGTLPVTGRQEGRELKVGYFAQHQLDQLRAAASPLQHLKQLDEQISEQKARNFLGGFGFHGDRAVEPIAPRSGGEKARLALALLAWQRPNLLLLDEPTNHLDLQMRDALALALQEFAGAVVLVTHDRAFMTSLCDSFLMVAGGVATPASEMNRPPAATRRADTVDSQAAGDDRRDRRRKAAADRERLKPLIKRVRQLESQIETLTAELAGARRQLADPELYADQAASEIRQLSKRAGELEARLAQVEAEWLEAQEALEAAGSEAS